MKQSGAIALLSLVLFAAGCKNDRHKELLLGKPLEPDIAGTWVGTLTLNGTQSSLTLDLKQTNVNVTGRFTGTDNQLGTPAEGKVTGVTTGPTFTLDVDPTQIGCEKFALSLGGQNDGAALVFNLTGLDCQNQELRGQAILSKL